MKASSRLRMYAVVGALVAAPTLGGCDLITGTFCDDDTGCPDLSQVCSVDGLCIDGIRENDAGVDDVDGGVGDDDAGVDGGIGDDDAGIDAGVDGGIGDDDAGVDAGVDGGIGDDDAGVDAGVVITITAIVGNGSPNAVSAPPAIDGGVLSPNRLTDQLVISGSGFDAVDAVDLTPEGGAAISLAIDSKSDGEMTVIVPNTISPGLMTLTLVATLAPSVSAQVFVVQGEAAAQVVSTNVEADIGDCPNGGRVLTVGADTDGDGVPNATPIILCNGAPGPAGELDDLSCAGGDCTLSGNLVVAGDVAVDGALTAGGDDVLKIISVSETRTAANLGEINSHLADLRNYRIVAPATVTIQLTSASYAVTSPIEFLHVDADRIQVIGDTLNPSSIVLVCTTNCFDVGFSTPAAFLNGFHMEALTLEIGTAINAFSGGEIRLGIEIEIRDFFLGISAENGAHVYVVEDGRVTIRNCRNGVRVQGTSSVVIPKLRGIGLQSGVIVRQGHAVVSSAIIDGLGTSIGAGLTAENGGTIFANNINVSDFEFGLNSQTGSVVFATNGISEDNDVGASAFVGSTLDITGTAIQTNVTGVRAQNHSIVRAFGVDLTNNTNEQDVSVDSVLSF